MIENNIYGHDTAIALFKQAMQSQKLHHAWLFCGACGMGKASTAYKLAEKLLHTNSNLIKKHAHPDLFVLESTSSDNQLSQAEIKVDQLRKLMDFMRLTPVLSLRKVVIIDPINAFNNNSYNALLKILEEPIGNTIFLMICHSINALPATIRSRCALLKFKPLDKCTFTKIISEKYSNLDHNKLYELSNGSLHLIQFLNQPLFKSFILELETFIMSESKVLSKDLINLKNKLADTEIWFLFSYFVQKFQIDKMKQLISKNQSIDNLIEWFQKTNKMLNEKNTYHLDASNVGFNILSQKQ